ncbi:adenosylcobinamide-phosphate synthase CbiB [Mesorhizobium sp. RP14(2022)]|uniref:Cobalamin biosynthesis protein CobD n=1 Tax=Mesorhizobium liriopis TaxID=2953882 RepID=A0ABT1C5N3_9HYPH|nr:adenosylcobinamide-phosphate synthase CbiB [Mesorhizobium liriopis]MCO6049808.1 adenosylcobinamide-phosphate synthase CbiB [Mesorhizobium liriopis]
MSALLTLVALVVERLIGYPDRLYQWIGHPVTWIGALIDGLDARLNKGNWRRLKGVVALVILVLVPTTLALLIQIALGPSLVALLICAVLASSLVAQRSLGAHVRDVADALEHEGLAGGRRAVSMIVGRDPEALDEAGVSRAAIESLAENFSDGITAPAFWMAVGGLPGAVAYKAANTADSMIGHRTPRHEQFGWAAARFDDLINLPASRLTALLIVAAAWATPGTSAGSAWAALRRDARKHRSPNAGWPEAAMAGALGLALAGPRVYNGVTVEDAFMGEGGRREANATDIRRALRLYWTADAFGIALVAIAALLVTWLG